MPYIRPDEPYHPYSYQTKKGRWRASPAYWNMPMGRGGYQNYVSHMNAWYAMEKSFHPPVKILYPNGKIRYKHWSYDPNDPVQPVFYDYKQWLAKAKKYALQRYKAKQQENIKARIERNRQAALAKRRYIKQTRNKVIFI